MISIISFGVIALLAVIFLFTFNVRSLSRSENSKKAPDKDLEDITNHSPSPRLSEDNSSKDFLTQTPSQKKDSAQKPLMSDEQYRNIVRQFKNPNTRAPVLPHSQKSDEEYRSALRSMSSKSKK